MRLSITLALLSISGTESAFLRSPPSTESSSADAFTESGSADDEESAAGVKPDHFADDTVWEEFLKTTLSQEQYSSVASRELQAPAPVIWITNTWNNLLPGGNDAEPVILSDYPSMAPSDVPSLTPSDLPSLAPSEENAGARSFTFMNPETDATASQTVLEIVMDRFELNWFKIMLEKGSMKGVLEETEGITAFAPVNEAFQSLDRRLLGKLLLPEYALHVRDIMRYHLLWWKFTSDGLMVGRKINTMEQDGVLGVILSDEGDVQLTSAAGPPASLIDTDITGSNGELHTIDQVLLPEFTSLDAMTVLESSVDNMSLLFQTISHEKFLAMVRATGLEELLRNIEEATVFLPDDDGVDEEIFQYLMTPGNEAMLRAVVEFQIVPFALNYELFEFMSPTTYATLQGETMTITRRVGLVVEDRLTISLTLMKCGHVYHTDGLLLPPSLAADISNAGNTPI